jgi:uncharacterized membrane protein YbhN (UPF0104 family)
MIRRQIERASRAVHRLREITHRPWARRVGYAISLGLLGLVAWNIASGYRAAGAALLQARWDWLALAVGLNFLGHGLLALNWHQMIRRCGYCLPVRQVFRMYVLTGVGRYLPGGIWHLGGRLAWLNSLGVPLRVAAQTVAAEQVFILWVALVSAVFFTFVGSLQNVARQSLLGVLCLLLLVAAGVVLSWIVPATGDKHQPEQGSGLLSAKRPVVEAKPQGTSQATARDIRNSSFGLLAVYCVFWFLHGLSIYVLTSALAQPVHQAEMLRVIGYASLSWAVGYLVILAPGGLGVREGVLAALLSDLIALPVASAVALVARLVLVISEGIWVLIFARD